jgi:hypothetical protein
MKKLVLTLIALAALGFCTHTASAQVVWYSPNRYWTPSTSYYFYPQTYTTYSSPIYMGSPYYSWGSYSTNPWVGSTSYYWPNYSYYSPSYTYYSPNYAYYRPYRSYSAYAYTYPQSVYYYYPY